MFASILYTNIFCLINKIFILTLVAVELNNEWETWIECNIVTINLSYLETIVAKQEQNKHFPIEIRKL